MTQGQNILTQSKFEDLFHALYDRLCRTSYRILQDEHRAEDMVQEVYCTLWRRREELQIENYEGYLLRSVYNASLTAWKKEREQELKAIDDEFQYADTSIGPELQLQLTETQGKIEKAIDALPTACRTIFILSRFENRSNKEIAEELALSVKTVENQMTKALRILRQALLFFLIYFKIF